jgi:hypothetical protein
MIPGSPGTGYRQPLVWRKSVNSTGQLHLPLTFGGLRLIPTDSLRYLPHDKVAYLFTLFSETGQRTSVVIPSRDNVLKSLAQLGAVKLYAE